jgi:hypothetical protein
MSDPSQAPQANREFNYGGQAVIEGVMMRGSRALAVAVRDPQGQIVVHTEPLDARIYGGRLARIPFLRGLTLLWDALGLGIKALMFSANVALAEEEEGEEPHSVFEGPAQWGPFSSRSPSPFCCSSFFPPLSATWPYAGSGSGRPRC